MHHVKEFEHTFITGHPQILDSLMRQISLRSSSSTSMFLRGPPIAPTPPARTSRQLACVLQTSPAPFCYVPTQANTSSAFLALLSPPPSRTSYPHSKISSLSNGQVSIHFTPQGPHRFTIQWHLSLLLRFPRSQHLALWRRCGMAG